MGKSFSFTQYKELVPFFRGDFLKSAVKTQKTPPPRPRLHSLRSLIRDHCQKYKKRGSSNNLKCLTKFNEKLNGMTLG